MRKHYLLLLAAACLGVSSFAQNRDIKPCASDEMRQKMILAHPEILQAEQDFNTQLKEGLKNLDYHKIAKRTTAVDETGNPDFWYDIPIVVHVINDYGVEDITDNDIFDYLVNWNIVYAHQNPDTSAVITPFIPYEGNAHIRLHLATKDPNGHVTKGITRRRSYGTYTAGDQAKYDDWPQNAYVNIWIVYVITEGNGDAAAYAYEPPTAAFIPQYDGVLCDYGYAYNWYGGLPYKTINHELGHCFNLAHVWGNTNNPNVACGDDDVDDTPPTKGHGGSGEPEGCQPSNIYDTTCSVNYFKIYSTPHGDSLVDYPDTNNSQNIMDYTFCSLMFTKGQVARMHAALNSPVAGRNNLWTPSNLYFTGVLSDSTNPASFVSMPDLKPIPDFSATLNPFRGPNSDTANKGYRNYVNYFTFPGVGIIFRNETWNDTVTAMNWAFNDGGTMSGSAHATADTETFNNAGWVDLKLTATGNNTGDSTIEWPRAVFVANSTGTPAADYTQQFTGADTAQWPTFNYYNNEFKWQPANVGYYDNNSMMYTGYDNRIVINLTLGAESLPNTGSPFGDFDDMFSIPMDLTGSEFTNNCSLNYFFSGASRSSSSLDINDTLEIAYGIKVGSKIKWTVFANLSKGNLCNKGSMTTPFVPVSVADWQLQSINVPTAARTNYTVFRFRYRPSVSAGGDGTVNTGVYSSGNNFYMDDIYFSPFPAGVANVNLKGTDVAVAPNPTTGDAFVIIKDAPNAHANILVTDVTGKVVYKTTQEVGSNEVRVQIPHAAIAVSGMYFVQVSTGTQAKTCKFVVE